MFLPSPSPWACDCCRWVLRFSYGTVAGGTDAQFLADKGSSVFLGQTKLQQMSDEIFQNMASIMALAERMAVRKNACLKSHFVNVQTVDLPRQARDKHTIRKMLSLRGVFVFLCLCSACCRSLTRGLSGSLRCRRCWMCWRRRRRQGAT